MRAVLEGGWERAVRRLQYRNEWLPRVELWDIADSG